LFRGADYSTSPWLANDQTLICQKLHRLADRKDAYPPLLGKFACRGERLTIAQHTCRDVIPDVAGYLLG
jgi:hypothetical protein